MSTAPSSTEDPPAHQWTKLKSFPPDTHCILCSSDADDPVTLGDLYQHNEQLNIICHYFCLLLSSSLVQNGQDHEGILGFLSKDILKEIRRGSRLVCSFCKKKGATIGCCVKQCRVKFHLPCGLAHGSFHQFFEQFLSFCSKHRTHQKVPRQFISLLKEDEDDAKTCPICYELVGDRVTNDTIWAPCCRKRWFHRLCLQRQALAQGYFFKCPLCNNKDQFNSEMKVCGIYIPEMDAAWELEPQAFQDLLHTYKMCDARNCQCPDGRSSTQNTGSWRLLRCNSCGSQGTHIKCSGLKMAAPSSSWRCSLCTKIMNKGPGHRTQRGRTQSLLDTRSPEGSQSTSPTPSTSSGSSTSSSSQRRSHVDVLYEQDRKRRKSSPTSTDEMTAITNRKNPFGQQVKEFVKEIIKDQAEKQVQAQTDVVDLVPGGSEESLSVKGDSDDDEDAIIVVDDSESDIEVVDTEKVTNILRTYPVSSELLTKDGKTIKVHRVSAEGHSVPLEIGSLGAVNMKPVGELQSSLPKTQTSLPGPKSSKVNKPSNKPSTSRPSTSKNSTEGLTQSVPNLLNTPSSSLVDHTSEANSTPSALGIKIGDVRHSNEQRTTCGKQSRNTAIRCSTGIPSKAQLSYTEHLLGSCTNSRGNSYSTNDSHGLLKPDAAAAVDTAAAAVDAENSGNKSPSITRCGHSGVGILKEVQNKRRLSGSEKPCPKRFKKWNNLS